MKTSSKTSNRIDLKRFSSSDWCAFSGAQNPKNEFGQEIEPLIAKVQITGLPGKHPVTSAVLVIDATGIEIILNLPEGEEETYQLAIPFGVARAFAKSLSKIISITDLFFYGFQNAFTVGLQESKANVSNIERHNQEQHQFLSERILAREGRKS
jgi:hypothetical protein